MVKPCVEVIPATRTDEPLLANLLELYTHDLSDIFGIEIGADGRYGYKNLPLYWSDPERRYAFLVRSDERVAGFVLVSRGSPASSDPGTFDMAEFFILKRHRRYGVGKCAAIAIWDRFPGAWTVRVSSANRGGCEFWLQLVREYTDGHFEESARPGTSHPWRVFSFSSARD